MYGEELRTFKRMKKTVESELEDLFTLVETLTAERDGARELVEKRQEEIEELKARVAELEAQVEGE